MLDNDATKGARAEIPARLKQIRRKAKAAIRETR
jgi:hypothetical protein